MSKSDASENDTLNAILRGVDPSWRANANRYIALHTADPGEAGTAVTNEPTIGAYARVLVVASTGFSVASGGVSSNTGILSFPEATSGTNTITHASIVTTASGAGQILYSGPLTTSRTISAGITGQFQIGALSVSED